MKKLSMLVVLICLLPMVGFTLQGCSSEGEAKLKATGHCPVCDLSGANLRMVNLGGAKLKGADLYEANLTGALLRKANLGYANLKGADLTEAELDEADLSNADLTGANIEGADFRAAIFCNTKTPWGLENIGCE